MTFVSEDLKTLLNEYTYLTLSIDNTTGISKWDTITQTTSGATAVVLEIVANTSLRVYVLAGDWGILGLNGLTGTITAITETLKLTHGGVTGTQFVAGEVITDDSTSGTFTVTEVSTLYVIGRATSGYMNGGAITGGTGGGTATVTSVAFATPSIRLISDDRPESHSSDGEVIIKGDNQVGNIGRNNHRDEAHRIEIEINYDGQSDPVMLNRLVRQIQHSFDAENRKPLTSRVLSTKRYYWSLLFTWSGNTRLGTVAMFVDCDRKWIVI